MTESRGWRSAIFLSALGAAALAGATLFPAESAVFRPEPLSPAVRDHALACVAMGAVQPEIPELSDAELAEIVELVGRLIDSYENREFASFLALRAADLDSAGRTQAGRLAELRAYCAELGVEHARIPDDWRGAMEAYWRAYYRDGAAASFELAGSSMELHREHVGSLDPWEASFDQLGAGRAGSRVFHRPSVPHRRSIARVVDDTSHLRWLDVQLAYRASDGGAGFLITRFVWDGLEQEWFLHRATTIHGEDSREDRLHLVL